MEKIKKRSDMQEEFKRKKIEKSVKSAGGSDKIALKIAGAVKHKEGLKTSDVRKQVLERLTEYDGKVVKAYVNYKKPAPVSE